MWDVPKTDFIVTALQLGWQPWGIIWLRLRSKLNRLRIHDPSLEGVSKGLNLYYCIGMTRQPYTRDLTDAQWALLAPLWPAAKPGGRPRSVDLREVLQGIL